MNSEKNKELTKLQKEFIENRNNKRKARLKILAKVLAWLGAISIGIILSYFIGNMFFKSFVENTGGVGYIIIFVILSILIYLLFGLIYDCKDIICEINTSRNYNKIDFAVRGFLTEKEYDVFACCPSAESVSGFYGYSTDSPNSAEEEFSEHYNDLQILVSILDKFITNDISSEYLRKAGKNLIANHLDNQDKIKEMFSELTERKNNKQYNFHCEDYKILADENWLY